MTYVIYLCPYIDGLYISKLILKYINTSSTNSSGGSTSSTNRIGGSSSINSNSSNNLVIV